MTTTELTSWLDAATPHQQAAVLQFLRGWFGDGNDADTPGATAFRQILARGVKSVQDMEARSRKALRDAQDAESRRLLPQSRRVEFAQDDAEAEAAEHAAADGDAMRAEQGREAGRRL